MTCQSCGALRQGGRFCSSCGAALVQPAAPVGAAGPWTAPDPAAPSAGRLGAVDALRDAGALALFITALTQYWDAVDDFTLWVLIPIIVAMLGLIPSYLALILVTKDGTGPRIPSHLIRLLLQLPLVAVIVLNVVFVYTDGYGLGTGVYLAAFGAGIMLAPRRGELHRLPDATRVLTVWRTVTGALGGIAGTAILVGFVIFLVAILRDFDSSVVAELLVVIGLMATFLGFIFFIYVLPVSLVARQRASWQPVACWLTAGLMLSMLLGVGVTAVTAGTQPDGLVASIFQTALLVTVLGAGLAAMPLDFSADGPTTRPLLWRRVVHRALTWLCLIHTGVFVFEMIVLVRALRFSQPVDGELIYLLVASVLLIVAYGIAAHQVINGAPNAVAAVITVVVLGLVNFIVELVVLGAAHWAMVGISLLGLVLVATFVPAAVRPTWLAAPAPPTSAAAVAQASPMQTAVPAQTAVLITPLPAPPSSGDPDLDAAANPATPGAVLQRIAAGRADLRPVIAANPSTYPDLLAWLGSLGDPNVDEALRER